MKRKDFDRDKFITETWPEALKSGRFKQTKGTLYRLDEDGYCCLGATCKLLASLRLLPKKTWIGESELPQQAVALLGIESNGDYIDKIGVWSLASDNDRGLTFKQIAKKIRSIHRRKRWASVT